MKKNDLINCLHIYSSNDNAEMGKAASMHSDRVREKYDLELIASYPKRYYKLTWIDRYDQYAGKAESVHEIIVKMASGHLEACKGEFLVVGYEGWRRHDENDNDHPTMVLQLISL